MVSIKKSCICRLAFSFSYDYSSKYADMDKCTASYYKSLPTFIDVDTWWLLLDGSLTDNHLQNLDFEEALALIVK